MLEVRNLTKTKIKKTERDLMEEISLAVLGKNYDLSLVVCADALSRRLNREHRGKDKPTNVLSFPIDKSSGEMFINIHRTKPLGFIPLFIHGCAHLTGLDHGPKMDKLEERTAKRFGIHS